MTHNEFLPRPIIIGILIVAATLFAGNHIAARFAFDNGTGLLLAVLARGGAALLLMLSIALIRKASFKIPSPLVKWQILLVLLIGAQSVCLYSAITRVPVAVALLLVNTWPIIFIVCSWIMRKRKVNLITLIILGVILLGLSLVLNVNADVSLMENWTTGVALGILSAFLLASAMWITQYQLSELQGSVRSSYTMLGVVILMALLGASGFFPNGLSLPQNQQGWLGLMMLAVLYGIAVTLLFVLTAKLDMARNSPILNFEPVASLFLGYLFLGQFLNHMQLIGGGIVILGIVAIGLHRK
jgi:drug/metabolite transporter (DMT)-like permease